MRFGKITALFNQDTGGNGSGSGAAAAGAAAGSGGTGGAAGGSGGAGAQGAGAAGDDGSLAAAAASAQGGQPGASGSDPGKADAGDAWFPQGLDAKFKGKDANETLTNLAKHLGEIPRAPTEAKDYAFKPADTIAQYFGTEVDNKLVEVAKGVAHKLGMSQPQFDGFINEFYSEAIKSGMIAKPVNPADEFTALGGKDGTPKEVIDRGSKRVLAVRDQIVGLETAGVLQKGEAQALVNELGRASGIVAMERLLAHVSKLSPGGGPAGGSDGRGADGKTDHERRVEKMYPTMFVQ
jgi:hypothetical protein